MHIDYFTLLQIPDAFIKYALQKKIILFLLA